MKAVFMRLIAVMLCSVIGFTALPLTTFAAVLGDMNGDGMTDMFDALALYNAVAGRTTLTTAQRSVADTDRNGEIDTFDAMKLYSIVSGNSSADTALPHASIRAGITDESVYMNNIVVKNTYTGKSFSGKTKAGLQMAVAEILKYEVGMSVFGQNNNEAWKAMAVAAYTLLARECYDGSSYDIWMTKDIDLANATDKRIYDAVGEVLGIKIAYNDKSKSAFNQLCQIFYSASSAGESCSTYTAWGYVDLEYLQPVESLYDNDEWIVDFTDGYAKHTHTFTIPMDELLDCVAKWMDEDQIYYDKKDGEYSLYAVKKDGPYWATTNLWYYNSGNVKTYVSGVNLYHAINRYHPTIHCYSHALTVTGEANGAVSVTTKGDGHGIGLSQYGVAGYANDAGWTYDQILAHYFSITEDTAWGLVGPKW